MRAVAGSQGRPRADPPCGHAPGPSANRVRVVVEKRSRVRGFRRSFCKPDPLFRCNPASVCRRQPASAPLAPPGREFLREMEVTLAIRGQTADGARRNPSSDPRRPPGYPALPKGTSISRKNGSADARRPACRKAGGVAGGAARPERGEHDPDRSTKTQQGLPQTGRAKAKRAACRKARAPLAE